MNSRSPVRAFFVAAGIAVLMGKPMSAADQFRPLFSDAALSGWVRTNTPPETWRFEDGVLYCTGKPIGELRTERMYQNFILELEWRHMVPKGNAGIFVWADDITSRGVPFHRGIEVQVLENDYGNTRSHTTHGDIFPIHGATMTPVNGRGGSRAFPTENRSNPSPGWNHYRIECRDGAISLAVNGKVVTRGKDCVPRKGYICLESEGGVVQYRNVRIQELPPGDIAPEQIAIKNRGYRSIYTGLDLKGWQAHDPANWNVKDWVLAFNADTGKLTSQDAFSGAGFVVDVRLKDEDSGVVIDLAGATEVNSSDRRVAEHMNAPGKWNRVELRRGEAGHHLIINDQVIEGINIRGDASGPLVLQPSGQVEFANLYVSEPE